MLIGLLVVYVKYVIMIFIMFSLFNAAFRTGFNMGAFQFEKVEKKVVFVAPLAYILIDLVFGGGFFASLLGLVAFVLIYAYFTGRLR